MTRVLYDYQIFSLQKYGGISRYFSEISWRINQLDDWKTKIFCPLYINGYLNEIGKNTVYGCKVPAVPKTGQMRFLINRFSCLLYITLSNYDIVHKTYYSDNSIRARITVVTVYDMINEIFPELFTRDNRTAILKEEAIKNADGVICISHNTKNDLLSFVDIDRDKVFVTHLGFSAMPEPKSVIKDAIFGKPYILYVGQRSEQKNFRGFIKAFSSSTKLVNDFRVVCFGGGKFDRDESELIEYHGLNQEKVCQTSGSDELLSYAYRNASVFVYPSLYEGFGIPALEAMSCGCPVACSDISSLPEVVGNAAALFDPHDIDSICGALEDILYSEKKRIDLIKRGRRRVQLFSWDKCAIETVDVYSKFL